MIREVLIWARRGSRPPYHSTISHGNAIKHAAPVLIKHTPKRMRFHYRPQLNIHPAISIEYLKQPSDSLYLGYLKIIIITSLQQVRWPVLRSACLGDKSHYTGVENATWNIHLKKRFIVVAYSTKRPWIPAQRPLRSESRYCSVLRSIAV